jgi:lysozyme family protein
MLTGVGSMSGNNALQRYLGVKDDGLIGPAIIRAWHTRLGVATTGTIDSATVKAIQGALNNDQVA